MGFHVENIFWKLEIYELETVYVPEKQWWTMANLANIRKNLASHSTEPLVRLIAKTSVTPSAITWFGFLITVGAAVLIITGHLITAGVVVLIAGCFDMLDGALARLTNQVTRFGAILDSTLDRLSEAVLLISILVIYAREQSTTGILLVSAALLGSLLVSYVRARAEALGLECKAGLFTRPERVIVLTLGLLLNQIDYALTIALAIMVVFSFFTASQRLLYVWKQTKSR
jgi:CDP-diacylglycerol--glycerol-3-phosphate 3-phosphatidyltransferase